jgi:phage baseplate assembly protein W
MSYPYPNDYPQSTARVGYSGPITVYISDAKIAAGVLQPSDSRIIIRTSIERILGTSRGSRVMRPDFGNKLKAMLFEPVDNMTVEDIKAHIISVINKEEPRITVTMVSADVRPDEHSIYLTLQFKYNNTGIEDAFNFTIK